MGGPVRVGIAPCLDAAERIRRGRKTHYLDVRYAEAVAAAGGLPLYLADPGDPEALVEGIDALLVPGGDDFAPSTPYPPEVTFDPVSDRQRDYDTRLLAGAMARGLPVLGVCYGMQLLTLALGGTLLHDIAHDRPDAGAHRLPEATGRHALEVEASSQLARVLGPAPEPVNSLHHQAVDAPGPRLRVAARAPDGVVEAVELPDADRFVVGVQWHPEKLAGAHRDALFAAFVAAADRSRT